MKRKDNREDLICIEDYGWKENVESSNWISLKIEENSHDLFICIEKSLSDPKVINAIIEKSAIISLFSLAIFIGFSPKKVLAETLLKERPSIKRKIIETSITSITNSKAIKSRPLGVGRRLGSLQEGLDLNKELILL